MALAAFFAGVRPFSRTQSCPCPEAPFTVRVSTKGCAFTRSLSFANPYVRGSNDGSVRFR